MDNKSKFYVCRLNKGFGLKFPDGYLDQQTHEDRQNILIRTNKVTCAKCESYFVHNTKNK